MDIIWPKLAIFADIKSFEAAETFLAKRWPCFERILDEKIVRDV